MGKTSFMAPRELIRDSEMLDKNISGRRWNKSLTSVAVITYVLGSLFLNEGWLIFTWILPVIFISIGIVLIKKRTSLSEREFVSYSLYKVYEGIKNKNLKNKYFEILGKSINYTDRKDIEKRDNIFRDFEIRRGLFFKNLYELCLKLNHAKKNDGLAKFSIDEIGELSRMIYYDSGEYQELLANICKAYDDREKFLGILDYAKLLFKSKFVIFVLLESFVIFVLWIIYNFMYQNMGTILSGFFILTASVIGFVATRKN